jgi:Protein of unknown function (DUF3025)
MIWSTAQWCGPRYGPYAPWVARLGTGPTWPTVIELDAALADGLRRAGVRPVRLIEQVPVEQASRRAGPRPATSLYEITITEGGVVPTRSRNLHDLCNALVWATFPRSKWALTERLAALQRVRAATGVRLPGTRTPAHDRLALLDEGGLIVIGGRAVVFGHAILEHAARGIDAVRAAVFTMPAGAAGWQGDAVDAAMAAAIAEGCEVEPGPGVEIDERMLVPWGS